MVIMTPCNISYKVYKGYAVLCYKKQPFYCIIYTASDLTWLEEYGPNPTFFTQYHGSELNAPLTFPWSLRVHPLQVLYPDPFSLWCGISHFSPGCSTLCTNYTYPASLIGLGTCDSSFGRPAVTTVCQNGFLKQSIV